MSFLAGLFDAVLSVPALVSQLAGGGGIAGLLQNANGNQTLSDFPHARDMLNGMSNLVGAGSSVPDVADPTNVTQLQKALLNGVNNTLGPLGDAGDAHFRFKSGFKSLPTSYKGGNFHVKQYSQADVNKASVDTPISGDIEYLKSLAPGFVTFPLAPDWIQTAGDIQGAGDKAGAAATVSNFSDDVQAAAAHNPFVQPVIPAQGIAAPPYEVMTTSTLYNTSWTLSPWRPTTDYVAWVGASVFAPQTMATTAGESGRFTGMPQMVMAIVGQDRALKQTVKWGQTIDSMPTDVWAPEIHINPSFSLYASDPAGLGYNVPYLGGGVTVAVFAGKSSLGNAGEVFEVSPTGALTWNVNATGEVWRQIYPFPNGVDLSEPVPIISDSDNTTVTLPGDVRVRLLPGEDMVGLTLTIPGSPPGTLKMFTNWSSFSHLWFYRVKETLFPGDAVVWDEATNLYNVVPPQATYGDLLGTVGSTPDMDPVCDVVPLFAEAVDSIGSIMDQAIIVQDGALGQMGSETVTKYALEQYFDDGETPSTVDLLPYRSILTAPPLKKLKSGRGGALGTHIHAHALETGISVNNSPAVRSALHSVQGSIPSSYSGTLGGTFGGSGFPRRVRFG